MTFVASPQKLTTRAGYPDLLSPPMKSLLPALAALAFLATPVPSRAAPGEAPPPPAESSAPADPLALPAPVKVTRWEDTGLKPNQAREWQNYSFTPQEAMNWQRAGFEPVVARTWSDKGFDADEAQAWRDSVRNSRTMMAEMDSSDPAAWKREGFTPMDRLAWWEAGFVFDDAVLLARAGMTPADAAWHGHEKLKELRSGPAAAGATAPKGGGASAGAAPVTAPAPSLHDIWVVVGPFLKVGIVGLAAFIAGGFAFFLYRRDQVNRKLSAIKADAPDSELPVDEKAPAAHTRLGRKVFEKRKPARQVRLFKQLSPHCIHCKSHNVRRSRMHPHKFAGINFTEYFRCKSCGRHFAIVSYTQILLTSGAIVLSLILLTASFIYVFSVA